MIIFRYEIGLDDLLSGRRPLQEDQMELVEPQLREPLERAQPQRAQVL